MDKVNGANAQARPIWDRQKSSRGHHSSVDGALKAHRERNMARQSRVDDRVSMVRSMQTNFFPTPSVSDRPSLAGDTFNSGPAAMNTQIPNQGVENMNAPIAMNIPEVSQFEPIEMDEIYNEASMGSAADNALGIVQKEMTNPEEGPVDDMPKGSYVDYTV